MRRVCSRIAIKRHAAVLVAAAWFTHVGCTSQMGYSPSVKTSLDGQDFETALSRIERIDKNTSRLLYLCEKGLMLHYDNRYEESNAAFEEAEKLYDDLYTKSLSREVGSLFTSDNLIKYRGDQFETALIHYYKILNYKYLSDTEDALVECRRLNHRLKTFSDSGDSVYVDDPFLQYFTGMVYFDAGEFSDADVSFRAALGAYGRLENRYGLETPVSLFCDLADCAEAIGDHDAAAGYRDSVGGCARLEREADSGTLNLFLECGYVSHKVEQNIVLPIYQDDAQSLEGDQFVDELAMRYGTPIESTRKVDYLLRVAIPVMVPSEPPFMDAGVRVFVEDRAHRTRATIVENVDAMVFEAFQAKMDLIMLKTISRALAKYLAKKGADSESQLAGWFVNLFNVSTEAADIRSWATLPQTIRMARLVLPEGTYDLELTLYGWFEDDDEAFVIEDVKITAGRSTFLSLRVN